MEQQFTLDNTQGYTQAELDTLNAEIAEITAALAGIEPYTDDWHEAVKRFRDEVAGR